MHSYEVIPYWSDKDEAFIAEVPRLPECAAHRDDHESTLRNITDAMQFWIEWAEALARPVRQPEGECLMLA